MYVGPTSDYTQLVKEYIPRGQKQTLWEQFLTGTEQTYQGLSQQVQDVASYDISQAYANYKQQQLQLQMNEQLGAGYQQQAGQQLNAEYRSAFGDIVAKESSELYDIESQKVKTIQAGETQFAELGEQLRTYDKLISEYAQLVNINRPKNATKTTTDQWGRNIEELTDYGRLWYSDVLKAVSSEGDFDKWLLNEESSSDVDYKDRVAFWEAYKQNPELFRQQVAGIGADFDAEATRTRLTKEEHSAALKSAIEKVDLSSTGLWSEASLQKLSTAQLTKLSKAIDRNSKIVSTASAKSVKSADKMFDNTSFEDDYGRKWNMGNLTNSIKDNGKYKVGDIFKKDGNYVVVHYVGKGEVRYTHITKSRGKQGTYPGQVSPVLPGY